MNWTKASEKEIASFRRSAFGRRLKSPLWSGCLRACAGAVVLLVFALASPCHANFEEIQAPFGFSWGESAGRLERLLEQAKARVVEREKDNGDLRLRVEGITQRMLLDSWFHFKNDSLHEIELHYGHPGWDTQQYTRFFDQTRRHLDKKYGAGRLVARTKSSQAGVTHSLMGYQWVQSGASLQLFLFTAEKGSEVVRSMSLHYRGH